MPHRFTYLTTVLALMLITSPGPRAQGQGQAPAQGQQGRRGGRGAPAAPDTRPFDPHDLSGYWTRNEGFRGIKGTKVEDVPGLTGEGERMLNANVPVRGREKGSPLNGDHPGFVRAVVPAKSNDPIMQCNPQGLPRLILDTEPTEWIQLPGRLIQYYQWGHWPREIWMDGRELPTGDNLANLGVSWFGMSVGKWEGDTLVITTVGLDDRTWLDIYGFPHSTDMRFEERYKRDSFDHIEYTFTITDPKIYKEPWVSDKKGWTRMPEDQVSHFGWKGFSGFFEGICSPADEVDNFNKRIRDPAGLGPAAKR